MSNMPILSNNTPASSKAATQATQNTSTNDAATQDAQPFGDVLARQISDKVGVETNAIDILTTDALPLATAEDVKTASVVDKTDASLPTDMLATLLPIAAAVAQMSSTAKPTEVEAQIGLEPSKGRTSKESASQAVSTSATPLNVSEPSLKAAPTTQTPKENLSFSPAAASADLMTFAKELEIRNKLDSSAIAPTIQIATPQANLVQSMASAAPTIAPATQLVMDTPVSQKQWGNEFSQKITWMATQQDQHAELHLNPAQLGPVDVVIKVSGDQATAQFTSAHAAVREVIEQSIPKLREMLADNGIMLGNTTVSDQAPREQRGEFGNQRQTAPNGRVLESAPSNMSDTRVVTPLSRHNGMVDTFA